MESDLVERLLDERLARARGWQDTAWRRSCWQAMDDRYLARLVKRSPSQSTAQHVEAYVRRRHQLRPAGGNAATWVPGRPRPRIGLAKRETGLQYLGFAASLLTCPPGLERRQVRHDLQRASSNSPR